MGRWCLAGIEDQFFTAAFIPDGTDMSLWHWTPNHNIVEDESRQPSRGGNGRGHSGGRAREHARLRGPEGFGAAEPAEPSLEELINFGWTGIIAKPLLFVLQWLHKYIPNYGWAIVLFTLALTTVLFPIRLSTSNSSRKMQSVAPEIRSIQDRYKKYSMSDPRKRKMNEEVMAVYSAKASTRWEAACRC